MDENTKEVGYGLVFMTSWVCRYPIQGKKGVSGGNQEMVYTLYRGRFHGENEAWYLKDGETNEIYELLKIPTYEEKGMTVYRVNHPKKHNLRFTHEKIKRHARRKETSFEFHRSDFVPR